MDQNELKEQMELILKACNPDKLKEIIKAGADVNTKGICGCTALSNIAARGNTDIAEFLLNAGADVNTTDIFGRTPLHEAVLHGRTEAAYMLIEHGADINARENNGCSVLEFSVWHGNIDCVRMLLSRGANADIKNSKGRTAFDILQIRHPELYGQYIKGFKEIAADFKHLKLEDSVKKSDTGYEFDI